MFISDLIFFLSRFRIKEKYFILKNCSLALGNMILFLFILDTDFDFYPSRIPDPGGKQAPDPGSVG